MSQGGREKTSTEVTIIAKAHYSIAVMLLSRALCSGNYYVTARSQERLLKSTVGLENIKNKLNKLQVKTQ